MPGLFRRLQQALEAAGDNSTKPQQSNQGFVHMANTAQARKRARQAEATRQRNASLKSSLRTAIKKVRKAIGAGDKAAATKELQAQQSVIDRIADKKVVHKNTASRSKARLAQAIKALP
jgi:small subunit ribosomal protein S20